jgi:hypothetical protein
MRNRPTTFLLAIAGTAMLNVAAASELKHTAPAKVDLTGLWKINPDLSDDPYEAVEKKRRDSAGGSPTGGGPVGGGGGRRRGGIVIDAGDILEGVFGGGTTGGTGGGRRGGGSGGTSDRPSGDPEPSSMRMPLDSFLATIDEFELTQQPDSLTISTLDDTNTCKPADPGEAKLPGGDLGKRRCGWQDDTWVTEIEEPNGVKRTNRYELKKGGRQLVMTSEIKGSKSPLSGLRIKRVYESALATSLGSDE